MISRPNSGKMPCLRGLGGEVGVDAVVVVVAGAEHANSCAAASSTACATVSKAEKFGGRWICAFTPGPPDGRVPLLSPGQQQVSEGPVPGKGR